MNSNNIIKETTGRKFLNLLDKNILSDFLSNKKKYIRKPIKKKKKYKTKFRFLSKDKLDYKDASNFERLITKRGKIARRTTTKLRLKQQHLLAIAIKKSRILSVLPYQVLKKVKKKKKKVQYMKSYQEDINLHLPYTMKN
nr:ribosomal protein S18 [Hydnora abyssinica]WJM99158.1 ribosomal protein S18 [Hydnora abyssinica]WJM99175.1 ribosomal protein S18 [Hydnora abyssinica]WJM99192.1 ribosomal protein S18 [Hydnora abyssinica]WJM99209.1 ribosomal protein S18 [Hydnora abyssinica]